MKELGKMEKQRLEVLLSKLSPNWFDSVKCWLEVGARVRDVDGYIDGLRKDLEGRGCKKGSVVLETRSCDDWGRTEFLYISWESEGGIIDTCYDWQEIERFQQQDEWHTLHDM